MALVAAWVCAYGGYVAGQTDQESRKAVGSGAWRTAREVSREEWGLALAQGWGTEESPGSESAENGGETVAVPAGQAEIIELTRETARDMYIPERVGLGLIWAESEFDPTAYRHTSPEDHSIGLGQQTFRWSEFWRGSYDDPDALARWRRAYTHPGYALGQAFRQLQILQQAGDSDLQWLCRYNKRDGNVAPAVRARYQAGLDWADTYLKGDTPTMDTGHDFSGGFADKAQEMRDLGEDPGLPLTDEEQWGSAIAQVTTTGLMLWAPGGQPLFLADIRQM